MTARHTASIRAPLLLLLLLLVLPYLVRSAADPARAQAILSRRPRNTYDCATLEQMGWERFGDSVYAFFKDHNRPFYRSLNNCVQGFGASLPSVHSREEMQFITNLTVGSTNPIWLGAQRINNTWTWIDGTPWDYENWIPTEPNNENGNENCLRAGHIS
ncbi:C-type lectin [Salpingoeca rosetta]|uniref:C-type lectin n=1 Tax=Salpingoeca rosetta (strain ATCC 50818 / BSB-021) TaxID=946362 RepID=F2TZK6_SALR5|nr:C-type lectin [Salpingoeca rosetta]EGD79030.1 C-type lectin [Salpingoeca rosetta]|eukprot:XP_004997986.1 C-type lectin [Salpingoeca rosetta]